MLNPDSENNSNESSSDDPDWDLLPNDLVKFFKLDESYDRKQLKRSYNRLLKRFKPEKHPEEFQKIRTAYEHLERSLRYGEYYRSDAHQAWEAATEDASNNEDVRTDHAEEDSLESTSSDNDSTAKDHDNLAKEQSVFLELASHIESGDVDLEAFYAELKQKENKEATDYYLLALVSDFIQDNTHLLFLKHLLQGLRKYPRDSGLAAITYRYLNDQVPDSSLPKVLVACSQSVRHDGFYQLTEGIWDRLIRIVPFQKFKTLLEECEKNLDQNEHKVSGRVVFYLHMLLLAVWKDDSGWVLNKTEYIEEHFGEIPAHSEADFEVLTMVRDYLSVRVKFINNGPECKKLDHLMESFFCDDPNESDRAFLEYQFTIAEDYQLLAKEIPINDECGQQEFFALWNWIAHNVGGRLITHAEHEVDYNFWGHRMQGWFSTVLNKYPLFMQWWDLQSNLLGIFKVFCTLIASVILFFILCIPIFATDLSNDQIGALFLVPLLITIAFAIWFFIKFWPKYVEEKFWQPYCERMLMKCFHSIWQSACMGFLRQSQLDYFDFRSLLGQMPQVQTNSNASWILNFVHQDISMAVYALAQKFRE